MTLEQVVDMTLEEVVEEDPVAAVEAAKADIKNTRTITIGGTAVTGTLDITGDNPPSSTLNTLRTPQAILR